MKARAYVVTLTAVAAAAALGAAPAGAEDSGVRAHSAHAAPRVLALPPLVRLAGKPTRRGARIRLLEIFAPPGATITVRCRGRTCPYAIRSRTATRVRTTFRGFRRRRLAAGTVVEVFIAAPGTIGKYTAFLIRRRRSPTRVDFCLQPGAVVPSACPRVA